MAIYYSTIGPKRGPYLARGARGAVIRVLRSPDPRTPIGMAFSAGHDGDDTPELWRLSLDDGTELPGRWVVVDREFRPAG